MIELEATKAKKVTVPKRVKRYAVAYYTESIGWQNSLNFFTTPESALEDFLRSYPVNSSYKPKFYSVYQIDLEIPVIE